MSDDEGLIDEWDLPVCSQCHLRRWEWTRGEWCVGCRKVTPTEVIKVVEKREEEAPEGGAGDVHSLGLPHRDGGNGIQD